MTRSVFFSTNRQMVALIFDRVGPYDRNPHIQNDSTNHISFALGVGIWSAGRTHNHHETTEKFGPRKLLRPCAQSMATAEGTRPQRTALGTLVSAAKARDTQPPKATDRSSRAVAHCYNRKTATADRYEQLCRKVCNSQR